MEILNNVSQNIFSMAVCAFLLVRLETTQRSLEKAIEDLISKIEGLYVGNKEEK